MKQRIALIAVSLLTIIVSCQKMLPPAPKGEEVLTGSIPDLTAAQEQQHLTGDANFSKVFSKADGLGPVFVQTSCFNCHIDNGKGHPTTALTRFANVNGTLIDYLVSKGGPQLQGRSITNYPAEIIPADA